MWSICLVSNISSYWLVASRIILATCKVNKDEYKTAHALKRNDGHFPLNVLTPDVPLGHFPRPFSKAYDISPCFQRDTEYINE